jgi:thiol:disulfide interchange protein DsbD
MSPLLLPILLLPGVTAAPIVLTVLPPPEVQLSAGGSTEATLKVTIKDGFRIQANPASERYLIPARLELASNPSVSVEALVYPPGVPYRLKGADKDLSTYKDSFEIRVRIKASAAGPADSSLEGKLHYQACNERICLRPASVPVRIPIRVSGPAQLRP